MNDKKESYVLSPMTMTDMSNFIRSVGDTEHTGQLLEFKHPVALLRIYSNPSDPGRIGIQQLIGCIDVERQGDSISKTTIYVCLRREFLDFKMFEVFLPAINEYINALGFTESSVQFISKVKDAPSSKHYTIPKGSRWILHI